MNANAENKPFTVIVANHPGFGTCERHARDEQDARGIAVAAIAGGATRVSICGPRGWVVVAASIV